MTSVAASCQLKLRPACARNEAQTKLMPLLSWGAPSTGNQTKCRLQEPGLAAELGSCRDKPRGGTARTCKYLESRPFEVQWNVNDPHEWGSTRAWNTLTWPHVDSKIRVSAKTVCDQGCTGRPHMPCSKPKARRAMGSMGLHLHQNPMSDPSSTLRCARLPDEARTKKSQKHLPQIPMAPRLRVAAQEEAARLRPRAPASATTSAPAEVRDWGPSRRRTAAQAP
mmetsp:Transcript_56026/g.142061  ORF Transcript_56026/g.142061 Transcript_56026/m.142061 type:complete len:224 (-) Transcript_56026:168-839(-)